MITKTAKAIVGAMVAMSLAASAVMAQQAVAGKTQEKFKGPIKVFILAGQSNMEGHGVVSMDGETDYNSGKAKKIKNAKFIKTTGFARPPGLSPNPGHGHHWFGNAESYFLVGDAMGEGMKNLLK